MLFKLLSHDLFLLSLCATCCVQTARLLQALSPSPR
jgi:hypothetical protein